jgi:hypothetical protein
MKVKGIFSHAYSKEWKHEKGMRLWIEEVWLKSPKFPQVDSC